VCVGKGECMGVEGHTCVGKGKGWGAGYVHTRGEGEGNAIRGNAGGVDR
jgi:hypothetical protein